MPPNCITKPQTMKGSGTLIIHHCTPLSTKRPNIPRDIRCLLTSLTYLDSDISRYFGFVKCQIVAPFGLYHPVLPCRDQAKLTFPLCPTCVAENLTKPLLQRSATCHHTREQRAMTGTWCTPEVEKALELGYEIDKIYEVWHFPGLSGTFRQLCE